MNYKIHTEEEMPNGLCTLGEKFVSSLGTVYAMRYEARNIRQDRSRRILYNDVRRDERGM